MNKCDKITYKLLLNVFALLVVMSGWSCKKQSLTDEEKIISPQTGTRRQFTLDSIYLYAQQTYLWNDILPSYSNFDPRRYDHKNLSDIDCYRALLFGFSQLKINPQTHKPYEAPLQNGYAKYSSIVAGKSHGEKISSISQLDGEYSGYGLGYTRFSGVFYVSYVLNNSPAQQAGLQRGNKVLTVNGQSVTQSLLKQIETQNSFIITVEQNDGLTITKTLTKANYKAHSLLKHGIIDYKGHKIGYLNLHQFSILSNVKNALNQCFNSFYQENIQNLVVDLRYNGGGYVETAQYLANLIAPSSLNGKIMYSEHFNTLMQQGKATILKNQLYFNENNQAVFIHGRRATMADVDFSVTGNTTSFHKIGMLQNLKKVYFIVSERTASASELLINALKPYMDVVIVGQKTYGKPVGFFGITIDNYTTYMSSFYIKNALGECDYFEGFSPDIIAEDDVTHDFLNIRESCLSKVVQDITGSASVASAEFEAQDKQYIFNEKAEIREMIKQRMYLKAE